MGDPLGGGEFEDGLFVEPPGVTVVDVFEGGGLLELGIFEKPLKP